MNPEDLIQQLAPLRTPDPIGFWPLAPVWWVVIGLLVIALSFLCFQLLKRYQRNSYRREALKWLSELQEANSDVQALSGALKATALNAYEATSVASLSDESWPNFLRESCSKLSGDALDVLSRVHALNPGVVSALDWRDAALWVKYHEVPRA
jgi:Lon protease-like protein